jgi:hypothetical protein
MKFFPDFRQSYLAWTTAAEAGRVNGHWLILLWEIEDEILSVITLCSQDLV